MIWQKYEKNDYFILLFFYSELASYSISNYSTQFYPPRLLRLRYFSILISSRYFIIISSSISETERFFLLPVFLFILENMNFGASCFNTPVPSIFSHNFQIWISKNFIQIWFRFQIFKWKFLIPPRVSTSIQKIHFKKSQNFTWILSRFYNSFTFCLEREQTIQTERLHHVNPIRATSDTLTRSNWQYKQFRLFICMPVMIKRLIIDFTRSKFDCQCASWIDWTFAQPIQLIWYDFAKQFQLASVGCLYIFV